MITKDTYEKLKNNYGSTSSWTIWKSPDNNKWNTKSNIDDLSIFDPVDSVIRNLNPNYIFVGLNPADHDDQRNITWANFHSGDKKRAQDYKLRYALQGTEYWGSFITDIYTGIVETDSNNAIRQATKVATQESKNALIEIRKILGNKATIVAIGNKSYQILTKQLSPDIPIKKIMHYSSFIGIEKYRSKVLAQLEER